MLPRGDYHYYSNKYRGGIEPPSWYKRLQMGVANSPEIFQQKMNDLFHGF